MQSYLFSVWMGIRRRCFNFLNWLLGCVSTLFLFIQIWKCTLFSTIIKDCHSLTSYPFLLIDRSITILFAYGGATLASAMWIPTFVGCGGGIGGFCWPSLMSNLLSFWED